MKKSLLAVTIFLCSTANTHAADTSMFVTKQDQMKLATMAVNCAVVGSTLDQLGKKEEGVKIIQLFKYNNFKDLTPLLTPADWNEALEGVEMHYEDTPENKRILKSRRDACDSIAKDLGIG